MPDNISRLPQWAQRRISKLEADVEWWQVKAHQAASAKNSRVRIGARAMGEEMGLPEGDPITFFAEEEYEIEVRSKPDDRLIEVRASDATLLVEPATSNVIKVRARLRSER
jgi:hypothetical protein